MYKNDDDLKTYYLPPGPAYKPDNLIDGVIVPGLQAFITGILAGIAAGSLTAVFHLPFSPWKAGLLVAALVTFYGWLSFRGHWQWTIERLLGIDLNRDGSIGKPEPGPQAMRVELIQEEGKKGDYIDLPFSEKLPALAAGLNQGRQFAQSVWTGNGALFSRSEFEELRSELLSRNLARWKKEGSPSQGIELTPAGRAIFRKLASSPALLEDK